MFSFQSLFLGLGSSLSQLFLSKNVMKLGIKLDDMTNNDICKLIVYTFVSSAENRIGHIICEYRNNHVVNQTYNNLVLNYQEFIDNVIKNYIEPQSHLHPDKMNFKGLFDVLLTKDNPFANFFGIIQVDMTTLEIFEPILELCVNYTYNTNSFSDYMAVSFTPFMKTVCNIYKKLFGSATDLNLEALTSNINSIAGNACDSIDNFNGHKING